MYEAQWLILGQAVSDMPAYCFSSKLIEAYPQARVILTLRDVDGWHEYVIRLTSLALSSSDQLPLILSHSRSMMTATFRPFSAPANRNLNKMQALTWSPFRLGRPIFSYVFEAFYKGFEQNRRQRFQEHYDFICSIVLKDKLLAYHA
jgi:hypothetical protein